MSERIRGSYDDALYKLTYTLLYFTSLLIYFLKKKALCFPYATLVCLFVRTDLVTTISEEGLNNLDETYREYSLAPMDYPTEMGNFGGCPAH